MEAEFDFSKLVKMDSAITIQEIVTGIKTDSAILGNRGEYARRVVVNAFVVWKQAVAAMAGASAPPSAEINLFEGDERRVAYTTNNPEAAKIAIQNASALINGILSDADLSRWMANAMLRRTDPTGARNLGKTLSLTINNLTAFITKPERLAELTGGANSVV